MKIDYEIAEPDMKMERAHACSNLLLIVVFCVTIAMTFVGMVLAFIAPMIDLIAFLIVMTIVCVILFLAAFYYGRYGVLDHTPIAVYPRGIGYLVGNGFMGMFRPKVIVIPLDKLANVRIKKGINDLSSDQKIDSLNPSFSWRMELEQNNGTKFQVRRPARLVMEAVEAIEIMTGALQRDRIVNASSALSTTHQNKTSTNSYLALSIFSFLSAGFVILMTLIGVERKGIAVMIAGILTSILLLWVGGRLWGRYSRSPRSLCITQTGITIFHRGGIVDSISWERIVVVGSRSQ